MNKIVLAALCAVTSGCATTGGSSEQWTIYAQESGASPSFAVSKHSVAYIDTGLIADPERAVRGAHEGGLAGDCSDANFRCFNLGGLRLVLPRSEIGDRWLFQGSECNRDVDVLEQIVTCRRGSVSARFVYDPVLGVSKITFPEAGLEFKYFSGPALLAPN